MSLIQATDCRVLNANLTLETGSYWLWSVFFSLSLNLATLTCSLQPSVSSLQLARDMA